VKRPASGIASAFIIGMLIAHDVTLPGVVYTSILLLIASVFLYKQNGKQLILVMVLIAALMGIWQSHRVNDTTGLLTVLGSDRTAEKHHAQLEVELLDLRSHSNFHSRYSAKLKAVTVNGNRIRLRQRVIIDINDPDWGSPEYPAGTTALIETFRISHDLKGPNEEAYLNAWRAQGYQAVLQVPAASLIPAVRKYSLREYPHRMRLSIEQLIDEQLTEPGGQLMKSIFFGNQGYLDLQLREQFSRTGTAHIIAVSGLHVGILALSMQFLLQKWGAGKRISRILTLLLIWFYAAMSGFPVSILRAGSMYTMYVAAFLLERRYDAKSILMWCAVLFAWINPLTVYSVSFQLSFMATASILWLYPLLVKHLFRTEFPGRQLLSVTLAAQLGTWPVIAWHFGSIALYSLPANLLIVPVLGVLMPTGLLMVCIGLMSRTLAFLPALLVQGGLAYMIRITAWFNQTTAAVIEVESIPLYWIALYYLLLGGVMMKLRSKTETTPPEGCPKYAERGMNT
jgi:competence protein ComEC